MPTPPRPRRESKKVYKPHIVKCMNLARGTDYTNDYNFTDEELFTLRPHEIKRYLALIAYGKEDPDLSVDLPTEGRSSSLEFAKKSISYYMPNRNMQWNEQTEQGNPARSTDLNDFIKVVRKKEVRKQGKPSCARRAMVTSEFRELIQRICFPHENGFTHKYELAAYFIFQFHMIAQVDDVMHFQKDDLTPHLEFDFALKSKICWSKNVLDERRTTDQIVLGVADPCFCPLLSLAIHLEYNIENGTIGPKSTLFGINKALASDRLKKIISDDSFPRVAEGQLGSHSTHKFAATLARQNGCSRDDVDARGRWKGGRRIVDLYIDSHLPYPDAKVAASLCLGGAVKYELRAESRTSNEWVLENVSNNICQFFPRQTGLVLGKALLWGACDEDVSKFIDSGLVGRIRTGVLALNGCYNNNINPVRKIGLIVNGEEGALVINELVEDDNDGDAENGNRRGQSFSGSGSSDAVQLRVLVSAVKSLTRQNEEMKNEIHIFKNTCNTLLTQLNSSVKRISIIPSIRRLNTGRGATIGRQHRRTEVIEEEEVVEVEDNDSGAIPYESTLCKCPKSLHILWQEYEFGVGGRKAAKLFSSRERGRVKFSFSLRNHYWLLMNRMILRGYTHTAAIDKIYSIYGTHLSATKILRKIRSDSKIGGHPQLR